VVPLSNGGKKKATPSCPCSSKITDFLRYLPQVRDRNVCTFSWEEKLVAPLIATPNVDKAIEDK
jgi:hypothetical protein